MVICLWLVALVVRLGSSLVFYVVLPKGMLLAMHETACSLDECLQLDHLPVLPPATYHINDITYDDDDEETHSTTIQSTALRCATLCGTPPSRSNPGFFVPMHVHSYFAGWDEMRYFVKMPRRLLS